MPEAGGMAFQFSRLQRKNQKNIALHKNLSYKIEFQPA
jgi:hypothetical protein